MNQIEGIKPVYFKTSATSPIAKSIKELFVWIAEEKELIKQTTMPLDVQMRQVNARTDFCNWMLSQILGAPADADAGFYQDLLLITYPHPIGIDAAIKEQLVQITEEEFDQLKRQ